MGEGRTNEGQWKMRATVDRQGNERGKGQNRAAAIFINPGWVNVSLHDPTSASVRCDSIRTMGRGGIGAGCVLPEYWPTMTEMKQFPCISQGIRKVQRVGPHPYGRKTGPNPNPLVYTSNDAVRKANNEATCPASRRAHRGRPVTSTRSPLPFRSRPRPPGTSSRASPAPVRDRTGYGSTHGAVTPPATAIRPRRNA